jgi:hypothetical protein
MVGSGRLILLLGDVRVFDREHMLRNNGRTVVRFSNILAMDKIVLPLARSYLLTNLVFQYRRNLRRRPIGCRDYTLIYSWKIEALQLDKVYI